MKNYLRLFNHSLIALMLCSSSSLSYAYGQKHFLRSPQPEPIILVTHENPSPVRMMADMVIARPLLVGATAVGAAIFLVSLPFTCLAGNVRQASHTLVEVPGDAAFKRCLGCLSYNNPPGDYTDPRYN